MNFKQLNIIEPITKQLDKLGYQEATPIQVASIPLILEKKDLVGLAKTGTGKTAAFGLPMLQMLNEKQREVQALIIAPTRELAFQIQENLTIYSRNLAIRNTIICGGMNQNKQVKELEKGAQIVIATPGRLIDLMRQRLIDLSKVEYLVLDEADQMLDMGFIHDIKKILSFVPKKRQTLLFSATMSSEIKSIVSQFLYQPEYVDVSPKSLVVEKIDQRLYYVDKANKKNLLLDILATENVFNALVFTRTKSNASRLSKFLVQNGISSDCIHGDKSQNARIRILKSFKESKIQVLVASDVMARGIDIQELEYVFNYEIPNISSTYVHRIGRSGRAGMSGKAISFCQFDEIEYVKDIEKLMKQTIPVIDNHAYPLIDRSATSSSHSRPRNRSTNKKKQGNYRNKKKGK